MKLYLNWFLWFALAEAIVFAIHFLFRKMQRSKVSVFLFSLLGFIIAVVLALLVMAGPVFLRPFHFIMAGLYVALIGDAVSGLIFLFFIKSFSSRRLICLLAGFLFFIYGTVNMQTVRPNYTEFTSDKLKNSYRIVFLSDLHAGGPQNFPTVEKMVDDISKAEPDFIVLGGDITDDFTTMEEAEKTYNLFGETGIPVYFIYGNHDRQPHAEYANGRQYTVKELEAILSKNNIQIIKNEYVSVADDLMLLGREDSSLKDERKNVSELVNPDPDAFLLSIDHQPFEKEDIIETKADLQLSGHTHAGQLFPLQFIYNLIGYDACGMYRYGDTELFVSPGAAGWRFPFRTDGHCRFEVITLSPAR